MGDENQRLASAKSNGNADLRIRTNQVTQLSKKFMSIMSEYQSMQESYQAKYREQLKRQYKVVKPDASQEELDAITGADGSAIMSKQIFTVANSADAKRLLEEVTERHEDIMIMEKSVIELHQLFQDLAILIDQQGNMVNSIEDQVESAAVHTEQAVVELKQAVVNQKKARKKKICCMILCFIILAIAGILIWQYWDKIFPQKTSSNNNSTKWIE